MLIRLMIVLCLVSTAFGGEIAVIMKGDPAPYDGFIIDRSQEKVFRQINEENKLLGKKVLTLEQISEMHKIRADYYAELNSNLADEWKKEQVRTFMNRTIYFIGGVLVTGFISYSAIKYSRR